MNWLLLTRGASALALPVALGATWFRRRDRRPEPVDRSEPPSEPVRTRPTRRDLRRLISNGESLADMDLRNFRLKGGHLRARDLSRSDLTNVDLRNADLAEAQLSESILDFADLSGADLSGADLSGASLIETSLWNADLCGADLRAVRNVVMANLKRASFDDTTTWPRSLDPSALGAVSSRSRRSR